MAGAGRGWKRTTVDGYAQQRDGAAGDERDEGCADGCFTVINSEGNGSSTEFQILSLR